LTIKLIYNNISAGMSSIPNQGEGPSGIKQLIYERSESSDDEESLEEEEEESESMEEEEDEK